MPDIGLIVRAAREKMGLSQEKLAELTMISQTTIDKIERGATKRSKFLPRIAATLKIPLDTLDPDMASFGGRGAAEREVLAYIDSNEDTIPIYSAVDNGDGFIVVERKLMSRSPRPWQLKQYSQAYGIYFPSNHMFPEINLEDTVYVNPDLPLAINHTYVFYGLGSAKDTTFVARLMAIGADDWVTVVWQPEMKTVRLSRDRWVGYHRVVGRFSRF